LNCCIEQIRQTPASQALRSASPGAEAYFKAN